jgi:EmrB/QacA subfamily drug resistance transporter
MSTPSDTLGRGARLVVPAMILAVSMSYIDQTIVAIASPDLQHGLHLSSSQGQWVINAYTVALAAVFALGGKLADTLGRRRMALLGVSGFTVASLLCGLTPSGAGADTWMITARVVQGAFAALLMPAAITTVYATASREHRGRAMAKFFGISGAFTALGPILGAYLLDWSWRLIFFVNVPVGIAAVLLILAADIPDNRSPLHVDWAGTTLVAAGMSASVIGFAQASTWGWTSLWTWAFLAAGALLLAAFVVVELRTAEPLVDLRIFASRGFRVDAGVLFLAMMAFVPVSYFLSVYANVSLGLGPNGANALLLTFFAGFFAAAQFGGRLFDTRGARSSMMLGCLVSAAGFAYWGLHVTSLGTSLTDHLPLAVAGAGIGLILGPSGSDAVSRASRTSYGEVTGANQTVRNYGSALGFAILGTLLSHTFTAKFTGSLVGLGVPHEQAESLASRATASGSTGMSSVPASMRDAVQHAVAHDFALGMRTVAFGMAAALVLAFVVALRHPGDRPAAVDVDEAAQALDEHAGLAPAE